MDALLKDCLSLVHNHLKIHTFVEKLSNCKYLSNNHQEIFNKYGRDYPKSKIKDINVFKWYLYLKFNKLINYFRIEAIC